MARVSCEKQFVEPDRNTAELGMPHTDISVAIHQCYDWFVENNYLQK